MLKLQSRASISTDFLVRNAVAALMCMLTCSASLQLGIAPFGMAFFCAALVCGFEILPCLFGAVIGFCITGFWTGILSAAILSAGIFWMRKFSSDIPERFIYIISALLLALARIISDGLRPYLLISAPLSFLGAVLIAPMYICALKCIFAGTRLGAYEKVCVTALFCSVILGTASLGIVGETAALIIAACASIFAGYACGVGGGAGAGVILGCALSLKDISYAPAMLALGGAFAGAFKSLGKIGSGTAFLAGALWMIWAVSSELEIGAYIATVCAFAFLLLMPKEKLKAVEEAVGLQGTLVVGSEESKAMREFALIRLGRLLPVLSSLSLAFGKKENEELNIDSVCDGCKEYYNCKILANESSLQDFLSSLKTGKETGLNQNCKRYSQMVSHARLFMAEKICAGNLSRQLRAFCDMTGGICLKLTADYSCDLNLSKRIAGALLMKGMQVTNVLAALEGDCLQVKLISPSCGARRRCENLIAPIISSCAALTMQCTNYGCVCRNGSCELVFRRVENLSPMIGVARKMLTGESMCGDSYAFGRLEDERFYVLLSDGMGCGREARQLSLSTVKLVEDYLSAGLDIALAAETANRYMSTISGGKEKFATLDLCSIDLSSGEMSYVKVSACHSYIISEGKVEVLSDSSLPLGMFYDLSMRKKKAKLKKNDLLIIMSDGICDENVCPQDIFIENIKDRLDPRNPQSAADTILTMSMGLSKENDDDRTVLVLRIL